MREDLRYVESLIEDKNYFSHPKDSELADFIDKKLEGEERDEIVEHLVHCSSCREVVYEVIEYKKKPKFVNNIIVATPLVAVVASLMIFIFLPQNTAMIGKIDLSPTYSKFRAGDSRKQEGIVDGDKFLEQIKESTDISYLEEFNQAEDEPNFYEAIGLYQEAINTLSEKNSNELKQLIIIRSRIVERANEEGNKTISKNYKELIINDIRTYYLEHQKKE